MTVAQRVGQLFMAGCSSNSDCTGVQRLAASGSVGAVILTDTSYRIPDRIAVLASQLQHSAGRAPKLFVATDQEGGEVQRLQGHGFDAIPAATVQGTWSVPQLRRRAHAWGDQLAAAGINLNLSPVLDSVPSAVAATNEPIGQLHRQFGSSAQVVGRAGVAVVRGYRDAGIDTAVKHFPGLGRVRGNTDTQAHVHDTITGIDDPYLQPFQAAIAAGAPFVMVSTAIYDRIDLANPAAFSAAVVTDLLRDKLGFGGVVISDDLANAAQVSGYTAGTRAVKFVAAGGDMVLTVDAKLVAPMARAIRSRMNADPHFAAQVNGSVRRILRAKKNLPD